jgi:hypothetical protein
MVITETLTIVQLPDGSLAAVDRTMSWGEQAIILLLVATLFIQVVQIWISLRQVHQS